MEDDRCSTGTSVREKGLRRTVDPGSSPSLPEKKWDIFWGSDTDKTFHPLISAEFSLSSVFDVEVVIHHGRVAGNSLPIR
jgi:hypothetical protein